MDSERKESLKIQNQRCDLCNRIFVNGYLKRHMATVHEKIKNQSCDTCGKCFGMKGDLNIHIKTVHENEKSYKCQTCNTQFPREWF